jgi:hypothetical protein
MGMLSIPYCIGLDWGFFALHIHRCLLETISDIFDMPSPISSGPTAVKPVSKTTACNNPAADEPVSHTTACNDPTANDPPLQGPSLLASGMEEESVTGPRDQSRDTEPWPTHDTLRDLVGLFYHSTTLVKFLIPRKTRETPALDHDMDWIVGITTPGTSNNRRFARIVAHWQLDKQSFGSQHYFDVPIAVRSHLNVPATNQDHPRACRLHGIFYQANIAAMVASLAAATTPSDQIQFLEYLDRTFPTPFLATVTRDDLARPDSSTLCVESGNLALEIRTRCLISRYMTTETEGLLSFSTLDPFAKRWNILAEPKNNGLRNRFITDLEKRFGRLGSYQRNRAGKLTALQDLHDKYPWRSFAMQLITWAQKRTNEIYDYLEGHRDIDAVLNTFMAMGDKRPALIIPSQAVTGPPMPSQSQEIGPWGCHPQLPPKPAIKPAAVEPLASNPVRSIDAPNATERLV